MSSDFLLLEISILFWSFICSRVLFLNLVLKIGYRIDRKIRVEKLEDTKTAKEPGSFSFAIEIKNPDSREKGINRIIL
jgi:hypothetical protein